MRQMISFRDFDWVLLGFVLLICGLGVIEIYSTTWGTKFAGSHIRQIYWIIGGLVLMFGMSLVNYQVLLENSKWLYIVSLLSLLAVGVVVMKCLRARRGLQVPGRQPYQP